MGDRSGQTYATVSGLVLGGIIGQTLTLIPNFPGSVFVIAGVAMMCLYAILAVTFNWPLPWRKPKRAALVARARALCLDILRFSGDERTAQLHLESEAGYTTLVHQSNLAIVKWNDQFSVRLHSILAELRRAGASIHPGDDWNFSALSMPVAWESAALRLSEMTDEVERMRKGRKTKA